MVRKLSKSEVSQKRVLDAAARIFRDYGYTGTTMRAVADQANLKAGSIYYHYQSKDELISAVLDLSMRILIGDVAKALAALPETATARERIQAATSAHLSSIVRNGDYTLSSRRVITQVPQSIRNQNMRLRENYAKIWQDILKESQMRGEFRAGANMTLARQFILGALNWTVEWFEPGRRSIEDVAREFSDMILDGLIDAPAAAGTPPSKPRIRVPALSNAG